MKKMKRYRVSLALKVPSNFEVEVDAVGEKAAVEKALEKYHSGDFDENNMTDADWSNAELDINEEGKVNDIGNGIFVEEIKK